MANTHDSQSVIVTGDVTMDWNLARTRRAEGGSTAWNTTDSTRACWQRGGAAMLADLLTELTQRLRQHGKQYAVRQMDAPKKAVQPGDKRYHHSYAMWSPRQRSVKDPPAADKVWRVEEFLGLDRCRANAPVKEGDRRLVVDDTPKAELVVLDDAALGFREQPELWPQALMTDDRRPWVLLKLARPVAEGALWEHLLAQHADRLIVVMTVNDLRLTEVHISRELSWERTAQDLAWELVHNPRVNALARCAHVVVSFDTAGALLLSRGAAHKAGQAVPQARLFFDPAVIEGMWQQQHPGGMIGYTSCLVAGIAWQLLLAPRNAALGRGIQQGLAALRKLHLEGYGKGADTQLAFPVELIADQIEAEPAPFAEAAVQDPLQRLRQPAVAGQAAAPGFWTILADRCTEALEQVARRIVREGVEAVLQGVPLGRFGNLLTVDRREIESFRSLRALVGEYCRQGRQKRPLSIAVFGAPGSGKSFGIVEVAKSLLPDQLKILEFNLSQFSEPAALWQALHQVRDAGLSGAIPLVFWDEFDTTLDSKPLGWLRYFLSPMQDGSFQEGQLTHPIGQSIFVFAGGTSATLDGFGQNLSADEFRAVKGPDFLSRLKGYVNILGPNRQRETAGSDPYYIIRRAILLRSSLLRSAPQLFTKQNGKQELNVDPGVLRAFLETREYKHGVRSIESIIAMSLLKGNSRFERSCLPAEAQLDLHVNGREFLALVQQLELEGALLEKLAAAAHEVFCEDRLAKGDTAHTSLKPYAELTEEDKEQNRGNVRDIPHKLALAGYIMISARSNEPPLNFPSLELERLAELEHERWVKAKLEAGWRWAAATDKVQKLHRDMLPWGRRSPEELARHYRPEECAALGTGELAEAEKEKDRNLVRGIPQILARVGYTLEKIREKASDDESAK